MTVLIDTSAWVEFFRSTGSVVHRATTELHRNNNPFLTCGPVDMELRAGARNERMLSDIDAALGAARTLPVQPHHFDEAATLYRLCRANGFTIRSLVDCLIAVIALSHDAEILHKDRDFNAIAGVVPLRVHTASLTP